MKIVIIDKKLFYNAVIQYTGKSSYEYNTRDVNDTAQHFGFYIKHSLRNEFKCEVLDEHKLFLSRIKYGF